MHYSRLSEKDRRQYAALETLKWGRGGVAYISEVLLVDKKTLWQGRKELLQKEDIVPDRQRRKGGGRKKTEKYPEISSLLLALIEEHKAGSPTAENVYWVSLKPYAIAVLFYEQHQIKLSNTL